MQFTFHNTPLTDFLAVSRCSGAFLIDDWVTETRTYHLLGILRDRRRGVERKEIFVGLIPLLEVSCNVDTRYFRVSGDFLSDVKAHCEPRDVDFAQLG